MGIQEGSDVLAQPPNPTYSVAFPVQQPAPGAADQFLDVLMGPPRDNYNDVAAALKGYGGRVLVYLMEASMKSVVHYSVSDLDMYRAVLADRPVFLMKMNHHDLYVRGNEDLVQRFAMEAWDGLTKLERLDAAMKAVGLSTNDIMVWVACDLYQFYGVRLDDAVWRDTWLTRMPPTDLLRRTQLLRQVNIFPDPDLLYQIGTKLYALWMKEFMLDTLVYPNDWQTIAKLQPSNVVIKPSLSSGNRGIQFEDGIDGFTLLKKLEAYSPDLTNYTVPVLVQPRYKPYGSCPEFRFFCENGRLRGVNLPNPTSRFYAYTESGAPTLNPYLYAFLGRVWARVRQNYKRFVYLRIDVIVDCGESADPFADLVSAQERTMYLNEIEPVGSGHKANGTRNLTLVDNGSVAYIMPCYTAQHLIQAILLAMLVSVGWAAPPTLAVQRQ